MQSLHNEIAKYVSENPGACVGEIAHALRCSEQTVRIHARALGVRLPRTTAGRMAEYLARHAVASGSGADPVAATIEQRVREAVERLMAEKRDSWEPQAKAPTEAQVLSVLDTAAGHKVLAAALRANGAATVRSALHANYCEPVRIALAHDAGQGESASHIKARMASLFAGRSEPVLNAFMDLIGDGGRLKLRGWLMGEVAKEFGIAAAPKPEADAPQQHENNDGQ